MAIRKKLFSLLLIAALCVNFLPVFTQAAVPGLVRAGNNPQVDVNLLSAEPSVIFDADAGLYKMWYTKGIASFTTPGFDLDNVNGDIHTLLSLLVPSSGLLTDLLANNLTNVANNDAASVKAIIGYLAGLGPAALASVIQSVSPTIGYATSADAITLTPQGATFTGGAPGSWEQFGVSSPSIIRTDATHYDMWYTGWNVDTTALDVLLDDLNLLTALELQTLMQDVIVNKNIGNFFTHLNGHSGSYVTDLMTHFANFMNGSGGAIGHATSADGLTWTKDIANPVLTKGSGDVWDKYGALFPSVIKNGTTFEMWYTGFGLDYGALLGLFGTSTVAAVENTLSSAINLAIGRATSTNGTAWTRDGANPVIPKTFGTVTAMKRWGVAFPSVVKDGATYHIWYSDIKASLSTLFNYIRGTNTFGVAVTNGVNLAIGHAESTNGIAWTADTNNPVLSKGGGDVWDSFGVAAPGVMQSGTSFLMWYTGIKSDVQLVYSGVFSTPAATALDTVMTTSGTNAAIGFAATGPITTLTSIVVTPATQTVNAGATVTYTATGHYSNGTTQNLTASVVWSSNNNAVASFNNPASPNIIKTFTSSTGSITVSAAKDGITGSTGLTVNAATLSVITVLPAGATIPVSTTLQYRAIGTYSDSSTADITTSVTWSVTNAGGSAASISNTTGTKGLLSGGATAGTPTVTATLGVAGSTGLTVTTATLTSIAVTPGAPSINAGRTQQFVATGTYNNASTADLTNFVTWASSAPAVAQINGAGMATGYTAGTSNITATLGVTSPPVILTVGGPVLDSIVVIPPMAELTYVSGAAPTQQFTAVGVWSNGTTTDETAGAGWTSSNASAAPNPPLGLATAALSGTTQTTTITATVGIKIGTANLVVYPDELPPVVSLNSHTDGLIVTATAQILTGTVSGYPASAAYVVNGAAPIALTLTATGGGNNTFSQAVTLATNNNSVMIRAQDGAGNVGTSGTRNIIVDPAKPVVTITAPATDGMVTNNPTLNVTGTAPGTTSVTLRVNGVPYTLTAPFNTNVPLTEGVNIITASAYATGWSDAAHLGTSGSKTVVLDTTPPVVTITSPVNGSILSLPGVTVAGTVNDPSVTTVLLNGSPVPVSGGTFSQPKTMTSGSNVFSVTAADSLGNTSSAVSVTVTFNSAKPGVEITSPANKTLTNATSVTVSGKILNPSITTARFYVNGATPIDVAAVPGATFSTFSKTVTLNAGANTVEVTASDAASPPNVGSSGVFNITVDTTAPTLTSNLSDPTDSVTITVNSSEELTAAPTVTVNATTPVVMIQTEAQRWQGTYGPPLAAGDYTVYISGTDNAANSASITSNFHKEVITVNGTDPTSVTTGDTTLRVETTTPVIGESITVTQTQFNPSGNTGNPEGAANAAGAFLEIDASPALRNALSQIYIQIDYVPADLPPGTDESTLRLYLWNTTIGDWELVPGSGVNTTDDYIFGTIDHLSRYGGFGTTTTTGTGTTPPTTSTVGLTGFTSGTTLVVNQSGIAQSSATLTTTDSKATIDITSGTMLTRSTGGIVTALTATILTAPPAAATGYSVVLGYDFGPSGALFNPSLLLTVKYDPATLPTGVAEKDLYIGFWDGTKWQALESTVNTTARTVSARVTHFTNFAVIGKVTAPPTTTPAPTTTTPPPTTTKPPVTTTVPPPTTTKPPVTTTPPTTVPPEEGGINWVIIGIIAAVVIVAIIVGVMLYNRRRH